MTIEKFTELAMSFPGTVEAPHFDRAAFKVEKKRIFATLHKASKTANLKLPEIQQSVFCEVDQTSIYPVPNKWGLQGWTTFELGRLSEDILLEALDAAYQDVFKPKKNRG